MKIYVTGLSGLIGSRIAGLAEKAKQDSLVSLDLPDGIDITNFEDLMRGTEAAGNSPEENEPGALIHLAAFTNVNGAYDQRGDREGLCYALNVKGTDNVARVCRERGLHLIHVSTDFVFDGEKEGPYTEADAPNPIEWYGQTKLEAEEKAKAAPGWTLVRLAFPYAAGVTPRPDLVRGFLGRLQASETLTLFEDQIITPTFAEDVGRALLLLAKNAGDPMRKKDADGEIFHVVGGTPTSPYELGRELARTFELDLERVKPSSLAEYLKTNERPRQKRLAVSNKKWTAYAAKQGVAAPLTLGEGLARVRDSLGERE